MNKVTFPLRSGMQRPSVADLQDALRLCLDRSVILANDGGARQELSAGLKPEREGQTYDDVTAKLVDIFQRAREDSQSPGGGRADHRALCWFALKRFGGIERLKACGESLVN